MSGDMTPRQAQIVAAVERRGGVVAAAKVLRVSPSRVRQVMALAAARKRTEPEPSRALRRQQPTALLVGSALLEPPVGTEMPWAAGWTPDEGRAAVDGHMRGSFIGSWQLWTDIKARFAFAKAAEAQRLAAPLGLPWTVEGPRRAPGRYERDAARATWSAFFLRLLRPTLSDCVGLGFSVWQHAIEVNEATGRHELTALERWPIASVGWTTSPTGLCDYDDRGELVPVTTWGPCYYAIAKGGRRIRLPKPGTSNARWTVIGEGDAPHLGGCVCGLDVSYTADGVARKSRSNLGTAYGRACPVLFTPTGVQAVDENGDATPEFEAAATVVAGLGTGRSGAVVPGGDGAKLDKFEVTGSSAGFFHDAMMDELLRVSLVIMGRGGSLAKTDAQYQTPAEMDVPESLNRADAGLIERAASGLLSLIAAMNQEGVCVEVCGNMPDTDIDASRAARAERELKRTEILKARREAGIEVTQEDSDALAFDLDLDPLLLADSAKKAELFAYHLSSGAITRGAAADLLGYPAPPHPEMTEPEFLAFVAASAKPPAP